MGTWFLLPFESVYCRHGNLRGRSYYMCVATEAVFDGYGIYLKSCKMFVYYLYVCCLCCGDSDFTYAYFRR